MKFKILMLLVATACIVACKNQDQKYTEELVGTWDVYASMMNNKPNGFMKDGYFTFKDNDMVESNLFEDPSPIPYTVKEGKLIIEYSTPFQLNIGSMYNDSLYLEGKMSHYYMEYYLLKRK